MKDFSYFYKELGLNFEDIEQDYFIAYINDRKAVTVIDLSFCVNYEKDDWDVVEGDNGKNTTVLPEAIINARNFAKINNLEYEPFESRYHSCLNESDDIKYENYI